MAPWKHSAFRPSLRLPQAKGRDASTEPPRPADRPDGSGWNHDINTANAYVDSGFIDDYNRRFAEPAKEVTPAWRKVPRGLDLDRVISFRYSAVVGQDNAVRLGSLVFDIPPGPRGCGYAKSEVEVRQLLDGRWRIYKNDRLLREYPATEVSGAAAPSQAQPPCPRGR